MDHRLFATQVLRALALCPVAAALLFESSAAHAADEAALRVAVRPQQYLFGSTAFDRVDALADAVGAAQPRMVLLDACGEGAAPALLAAAHALRRLPLQLRSAASVPAGACGDATAMRAVSVSAQGGPRIDAAAVQRYWRSIEP